MLTLWDKFWLYITFDWKRLHRELEGDWLEQQMWIGFELSMMLKITLVVVLLGGWLFS